MPLNGAIFNVITIIAGGLLGLLFKKGIPQRFQDIITKGMALCVLYIGISGTLQGKSPLVLVISVAFGAALGELLNLDGKLNRLGDWVQSKFKSSNSPISQGFVTATLLFAVGAMAIVGSLQGGLQNDHSIIYTKSIIDGVMAIILTSQLGFGVMLSAVPIFLYQGGIALAAGVLEPILSETAIAEMSCSGSLLIVALGMNMLGITKLKVVNYIPAIFIAGALSQIPLFY